jgi:hypothetical protein
MPGQFPSSLISASFIVVTWLGLFAAVPERISLAQQAVTPDAVDRLAPKRIAEIHTAVKTFATKRKELTRPGPFADYRANLHVHSLLSHDSRGKPEEIIAAAKKVGTKVILFSEHPADHYDFVTDGHQGLRDGVLLIPGAETKGLLAFPKESVKEFLQAPTQEFSDIVTRRGGMTFLSHLEERMDLNLGGITGNEIYNTHADFKTEKRLIANLKNPLWLVQSGDVFQKYPREAISALQDYPEDYLRRWDELCLAFPHCGVSANDAHQNTGIVIKLADSGKVLVEDPIGNKLLELDAAIAGAVMPSIKTAKPGDELYRLQLDYYENSLALVGTHLLMKEHTKEAVWDALQNSRAYVAFDWIADATGFDFALHSDDVRHEMGSRVESSKNMSLRAQAPLKAHWRLIRSGKLTAEANGNTFDYKITEPGVYRIEAWLDVAGESRIWVLSNPIYVSKSP